MTISEMNRAKEQLKKIGERLDSLQDLVAWLVPADHRFRKRQRVKFSAKSERRGVARRRGGVIPRGTVVGTAGFSVNVLLDGYKKPQSFHHSFFDKVGR